MRDRLLLLGALCSLTAEVLAQTPAGDGSNPHALFKALDRGKRLAERAAAATKLVALAESDEKIRNQVRRRLTTRTSFEPALLLLEAMEKGAEQWKWKARWKALEHYARPVRHLAAEVLTRNRDRGSIPRLIKALKREKKISVKRAIVKALEGLTLRPFGTEARAWASWWKENAESFKLPAPPKKRSRPKRKGERKTVAQFYGLPVDSTEIIFVIDRSASMYNVVRDRSMSRWRKALNEVLAVVDKLPKGVRVNVVFFMSDVWTWRPRLTPLTKRTRKELRNDLASQQPGGGTWLYDGLKTALSDPEVETIYLLSDGEPTGGDFVNTGDIVREISALNRLRRAVIHCVAIGYGSPLLRQIAERSGGRYVSK